ncbi:hypothetical protein JHD48_01895 [Sulfurimonas sp. SAG-AH-194-I05]|nr:hypothetical protein [Sulfurimonas sp. SAG-AH-194-I05]MDF1874481.1 hypothetical protein [Sulfurimonas sp. SAG-AH-194-I05]
MKSILIMVLFSSMLFSMQKQIIVGSYSYPENAKNEMRILETSIEKNTHLTSLIEKNDLKIESRKIGRYTVVSLNYFTAYPPLYSVIKEIKKYYNDAYILTYNTSNNISSKSSGKKSHVKTHMKKATPIPIEMVQTIDESIQKNAESSYVEIDEVISAIKDIEKEDAQTAMDALQKTREMSDAQMDDMQEMPEEMNSLDSDADAMVEEIDTLGDIEDIELGEGDASEDMDSLAGEIEDITMDETEEKSMMSQYSYYFYILGMIVIFFIIIGLVINRKYKTTPKEEE